MITREKNAQLARIGRLVRDSARALNANQQQLGWGRQAVTKYTAPGVSKSKTLYPSLAFGSLGAVTGGIQQARSAAQEGDPYLADRALQGAVVGGLLGGLAGTQYFRWGRRSGAIAAKRSADIAKRYRSFRPADVNVLQKAKGKFLPTIQPKAGIVNPNVLYSGLGRKPVKGFTNIMRHGLKGTRTPGSKAKAIARQLHEQAIVRGYMGRGGLTQYVPNLFGSKLFYGTALGGAGLAAVRKPKEGDTRARAVARNLAMAGGGALTHNAGMLLNMGAFLGPDVLLSPKR